MDSFVNSMSKQMSHWEYWVKSYPLLQEAGDYKICFDNKFSYLSSKVVYFEILNVNEDEDYDDLAGLWDENGDYAGEYDVEVSDIEVHKYKQVLWCHFEAWNLYAWVS